MSQNSFDFDLKPDPHTQETQKWVERHNQQVLAAEKTPAIPPGSLLAALDGKEAKANAVYLLRGLQGMCLRKSGQPHASFRAKFLHALQGEMSLKTTTQDLALIVRHTLLKIRPEK
ncbi:MAG: hypothetical protein FJX71_03040 [Alphaproteobacteria bacterium]|nr:hypothetical protein [Alphaproteobacteria bacterium]